MKKKFIVRVLLGIAMFLMFSGTTPAQARLVTFDSAPHGANVYLGSVSGYTFIGVTPFLYDTPPIQTGFVVKKTSYGNNFGYIGPDSADVITVALYYWGPPGPSGWCGINGDGSCPGACAIDQDSDCGVFCGNGTMEGAEVCDGAAGCAAPNVCSTACNACNPPPSICGNGIKEGAEVCDGAAGCIAPNVCSASCNVCDSPPPSPCILLTCANYPNKCGMALSNGSI